MIRYAACTLVSHPFAQAGINAWQFCDYDDGQGPAGGVAFPRDCGPSSVAYAQWNSKGSVTSAQPSVRYEVLVPPPPASLPSSRDAVCSSVTNRWPLNAENADGSVVIDRSACRREGARGSAHFHV